MSEQDIKQVLEEIILSIERNQHQKLTLYNGLAPLYDYLFGGAYNYDIQVDYIQKISPESASLRLLEAGCGTGRLLEMLDDRYSGATLHGVDISEGMIKIAESRLSGCDNTMVKYCDVFDIKSKYNVFAIFNTLPHFDKDTVAKLFNHAGSILTNDGALVFDYKDPENNPNGQLDVWKDKVGKFTITVRFLTVYDDSDPYYAVSYEFERGDEQYLTGELMKVNFHSSEMLEKKLRSAGFHTISFDYGVGDQSGIVTARV